MSSRSERLGVEARPTLKRVRANMKLTAATMIISRVCVHHFERFERTLRNVSDEIRLKVVPKSCSSVGEAFLTI